MTAGSGIVHEEFHSPEFTRRGGTLEMVQLWVNLPASKKMTEPSYQTLLDANIPVVDLPRAAGRMRLIAGETQGVRGPARTFTPMAVWDLRLNPGGAAKLALVDGWNALLVVLRGCLRINHADQADEGQWVVLSATGAEVAVQSDDGAVVLVLAGQPIDEPLVGHGPFVMNSANQIRQAIEDYRLGRFGRLQ